MKERKPEIQKKELLKIFSEIDARISNLHACSEKDFKQLNAYLKEYHSKTKVVFDNATSIFDLLGGSKGTELARELEDVRQGIRESKRKIEENHGSNIQVMENTLAKVILLTVALKNFKQDLTTYKFLFSNYTLLSSYEHFEEEKHEAVYTTEGFVKALRNKLPSLEKELESIKDQLYTAINKSKGYMERSSANFRSLIKEVDTCTRLVTQKTAESNEILPLLTQKTGNASKSIGNIITHLQYHDIIWQKIDHIKRTHARIIDELKEDMRDLGEEADGDMLSSYQRVADISELQAAQLILVNREYQSAIEVIIRSFQQMGNDLAAVTSMSHDFSIHGNSSEITLISQVKGKLDAGINVLDLNNFTDMVSEQKALQKSVSGLAREVKVLQKKMESLSLKTLLDEFRESGLESTSHPRVLSQLSNLGDEVVKKMESVHEAIRDVKELTLQFSRDGEDPDWGHQLEKDRIGLMIHLTKILEGLDVDNQVLDEVLKKNQEFSNAILSEIKGTIHSVDYYDLFEKVIEEIIQILNNLNVKLYPDGRKSGDKKKSLEGIRDLYTMKSERVIHDQVEGDMEDNIDLFDEEEGEKDEDDLELF
ncbi:MAG: hypothetical protein R2751_10505 [Bacteroidales bacterium]